MKPTHLADCGLRGQLTEAEASEVEIHQARQQSTGDTDGFLHSIIMDIVREANERHDRMQMRKH